MINSFRDNSLLLVVIVIATILRLYNLSNIPPGLTWDEAALGYNAYSILLTGKDEYGTPLPLNLKSFGDYKPAIYIYLTIPFVAILGLNELAVRLPSAIAGIGLVYIIYLLTYEISKDKNLSGVTALLISISPLAIQFSRPAYEANLALFLNIFGLYLFIKSINKKYLLPLSIFIFGLSTLTYQSSRLFIPLLLIGIFIFFKNVIKFDKYTKLSLGILSIFVVILVLSVFIDGQSNRISALNYFAYKRSTEQVSLIQKEDGLKGISFDLLHGEWFAYVRGLFERYLIYFSPKLLFIQGDYNPRFRVPDLGILSYYSLLFIPVGLLYLLKSQDRRLKLILYWLLIAPMPAVLSRDLISSIRALNLLLPLAVMDGIGLYLLINFAKNSTLYIKYIAFTFISLLIIVNLSIFLDRYFIHMPKEYSQGWLYGYKETMQSMEKIKFSKDYNKVVVTDYYGQPYIYYLFYSKYPPEKYQEQAVLDQSGVDVGTVRGVDNIEFRHVYWPVDRGAKNTLFIATTEELPDKDLLPFPDYNILKDTYFLDGTHAFRMVETR